jgi:mRNA-degrading endonuclease RelE of RelBE toxin-antitoxin system
MTPTDPPRDFRPPDWLQFIQLTPFERKWGSLGLTDDDLRALETVIISGPKRAPIVKRSGGLRKLRFGDPHSHRGKSGAFRVCYAYFEQYRTVALITIFGKKEKSDLSMADRKGIASVIAEIEHDLIQSQDRPRDRSRKPGG